VNREVYTKDKDSATNWRIRQILL